MMGVVHLGPSFVDSMDSSLSAVPPRWYPKTKRGELSDISWFIAPGKMVNPNNFHAYLQHVQKV